METDDKKKNDKKKVVGAVALAVVISTAAYMYINCDNLNDCNGKANRVYLVNGCYYCN